jgi:hypothetical protein
VRLWVLINSRQKGTLKLLDRRASSQPMQVELEMPRNGTLVTVFRCFHCTRFGPTANAHVEM